MKKIGIVGGVGWRSTVDYYGGICLLAEEKHRREKKKGPIPIPEICIESLDLAKAIALLDDGEERNHWGGFDAYHREALKRLEAGGADFALIASNTPHDRFDEIVDGIDMPVINIFEVAARRASAAGYHELLLLGTPLTMASAQVRQAFERHGIQIICPPRRLFLRISQLIARLQRGEFANTKNELQEIVRSATPPQSDDIQAVCLACTDLALAVAETARSFSIKFEGFDYLDPTAAHIEEAFGRAVQIERAESFGRTP
jgi:aspartate racemase